MKSFIYVFVLLVAVTFITSCSENEVVQVEKRTKEITFTCGGDFSLQSITPITRATVDDINATDLWVFDYTNGELIQEFYQKRGVTEDFGNPTLNLGYGHHKLYFVISNGSNPIVDNLTYNIRWDKVGDTFHSAVDVDINDSSDTSFIVNMNRIASKLVIQVKGGFPDNAAQFKFVTPQLFYSINYITGGGVHEKQFRFIENIQPNGEYTYYTLLRTDKLNTQGDVFVLDTEGETIASAHISPIYLDKGKCSTYAGKFVYKDSFNTRFDLILEDWKLGDQGTW